MRLHYPLNANGAEDAGQLPWKDGVPSTGVEGSYPGHAIVTDVEAEILAAIDAAGLSRSGSDLTQLIQAAARGIWLGQFGGTNAALTATIPNAVVLPALVAGMRVRGIAASDYSGTGGTLAITGIGAAGTTVSFPIVGAEGTASTPLSWKAGQFLTFDIDAAGNARFNSVSSITQISAALENNIATTAFQTPTSTGMANGSATALVFADPSVPNVIANDGVGTFTCYQPGAYSISITATIITNLNQAGSNDSFAQIVVNGQILGFNKTPYYAPNAENYIGYVSATLQRGVIRLNTGDKIVFGAGVTVPAGYVSAVAQNHVAQFSRLF